MRPSLQCLDRMDVPDNVSVELRVADNDRSRSAEEVVTRFRMHQRTFGCVRYVVVAEPNIARARNATVNLGYADRVLFLDDDEIADMAHRRWASAMDGVEPDARLDVGAWWSQTASSDDARAALPKALRVYLPTVEQEAPATASAPAARPRIGTPSNRSRRAPAPGSTGEITPSDLAQMSSEQAQSLRANFWKSAGVT